MNEKLLEYFKSDDIHLIQCEHKWCDAYGYEKSQMKKDLLKYITNLQQDLDKANDIIEKDRQFYKCRMDEYAELKEENERLKELNICVGCENNPDYKSRFEKAIKYIMTELITEWDIENDGCVSGSDLPVDAITPILNILQGSDEE